MTFVSLNMTWGYSVLFCYCILFLCCSSYSPHNKQVKETGQHENKGELNTTRWESDIVVMVGMFVRMKEETNYDDVCSIEWFKFLWVSNRFVDVRLLFCVMFFASSSSNLLCANWIINLVLWLFTFGEKEIITIIKTLLADCLLSGFFSSALFCA